MDARGINLHDEILRIVRAEHWNPFQVLGPHPSIRGGEPAVCVRVFRPDAREAFVITDTDPGSPVPMEKKHPEGFFEAVLPRDDGARPYRLRLVDWRNRESEIQDPYAFPPVLTDFDLHLIGEGKHYRTYEKLGAHLRAVNGAPGVHFAVWAPNARRVSLIGGFNHWDGRIHQMRLRGTSGIWEIFIPGMPEGSLYKFEIRPNGGGPVRVKADPYAFLAEVRPKTASIVHDISKYRWNDRAWVEERAKANPLDSPMSIYEVHLGSWRRVPGEGNRPLTYRELARDLVPYVKEMGYTHVELLPVMEHPLDASWGYQVTGYFAATSRFGPPEDLMFLIDQCHQNGIGVILDWVPAHFPADDHALRQFDGTCLYEHEDPRKGFHQDWGTLIFNYGRNEVKNFLISNALFWLDHFHADGLRVDAVASVIYLDYSRRPGEWVPNAYGGNENLEAIAFIRELNEVVHREFPGAATIAEESTAWPAVSRPTYLGGLGFSLKWNMGWMHDMLDFMSKDPVHRKYHHGQITFGLLYAFTENFVLPLSHDEVVHGKRSLLDRMPGDFWQKFASLRLFYGFMHAYPGKKLIFMGGEFGQWWEWDEGSSLQWHLLEFDPHEKLRKYVRDLNALYRSLPALWEVDFHWEGFEWIDFHDADHNVIAFLRRARDGRDFLAAVCNFTPVPQHGYRIGVPEPGFYREILNSDSEHYGGSNVGNIGGVTAEPTPWQGRPFSLSLTLPPLAAIWLRKTD